MAAAGKDMQLAGDLAFDHFEIIPQAVLGRDGFIVLAEQQKRLGSRSINLILKGIVLHKVNLVVGQVGARPLVGNILLESDHRINKHTEVGPGHGVDPKRRSAGGQMPACREAYDSQLLYPPLFLVGAAVTERILHIRQRHLAMMVGHTVKYHAAGYSVLEAPSGHARALVIRGAVLIPTAGAADKHLPVTLLGKINVDVRIVDIAKVTVTGQLMGSAELIVVAGAESHAHSVLNYTFIDGLSLGIKLKGNGRFYILGRAYKSKKGRKGP